MVKGTNGFSGFAVTTFIFGILSIITLISIIGGYKIIGLGFYTLPFVAIIGIILGFVSMKDIRKNNKKGKVFVIAGVIICIIILILVLLGISAAGFN